MTVSQTVERKPDQLKDVPTADLVACPWGNPRSSRDPKKYNDLRESIKAKGIHTPLQGRQREDGKFEVLCGNGRWGLALELELPTVPFIVKQLDDFEARALALSDNIDREQLSQVDEARAAKGLIGQYSGDMQAVANHMGWTDRKLKQYLQLLRCTERVLSKVGIKNDNGFTLTVGHAGELSRLEDELQDQLLGLIIQEKMKLSVLRGKIEKAIARPICQAIFDTGDCAHCEYNSQQQVSLFDNEAEPNTALCNNPTCYNQKTDAHYTARRIELEKEYGTVVMLSCVEGKMVEVNETSVGKKCFVDNCSTCPKNVAVLADKGLNRDAVLENQCIDLDCNTKMVKAKSKPATSAKPAKADASKSSVATNKLSKGTTDATDSEPAPTAPAARITKAVQDDANDFLRHEAALLLAKHPSYTLALTYATLKASHTASIISHTVEKHLNDSPEELQKLIGQEIQQITFNSRDGNPLNAHEMVRKLGKHLPDLKSNLTAKWLPTEAVLKNMQKGLRVQIMEQSGFAEKFTQQFGEKGYKKLLGLDGDNQIKAIVAYEFDWSGYVPEYVLNSK
ncbi:ParB/RepB/Spo0J family partition protein [Photobacterium ganghwense]|uniref:ParB/RepB/Spo0J family partition protein n=1 Tax=Photobacterium ganghwense TaxID=320778 RepID=UPI001A8E5A6C|nr:ParB/RepB/Spo0J family partition protein [Photobacterium ganghwense]QSV17533.1 ParB/RepB/Spo0J family partition protein [Photobacterium ganghwense]